MKATTPELKLHLSMLEHVIWKDTFRGTPVGIDDKAAPEEKAEYERWRAEVKRKDEMWARSSEAAEQGDPNWERFLPENWDIKII